MVESHIIYRLDFVGPDPHIKGSVMYNLETCITQIKETTGRPTIIRGDIVDNGTAILAKNFRGITVKKMAGETNDDVEKRVNGYIDRMAKRQRIIGIHFGSGEIKTKRLFNLGDFKPAVETYINKVRLGLL